MTPDYAAPEPDLAWKGGLDLFDDDLFDAEVLVERSGIGHFTSENVAQLLGVNASSVRTRVGRGVIPPPDHFEVDGRGRSAIWTKRQVVGILADRSRRERRYACGTPAGYRRHRRAGQEACEECRRAASAARVERNNRARRSGRLIQIPGRVDA